MLRSSGSKTRGFLETSSDASSNAFLIGVCRAGETVNSAAEKGAVTRESATRARAIIVVWKIVVLRRGYFARFLGTGSDARPNNGFGSGADLRADLRNKPF